MISVAWVFLAFGIVIGLVVGPCAIVSMRLRLRKAAVRRVVSDRKIILPTARRKSANAAVLLVLTGGAMGFVVPVVAAAIGSS